MFQPSAATPNSLSVPSRFYAVVVTSVTIFLIALILNSGHVNRYEAGVSLLLQERGNGATLSPAICRDRILNSHVVTSLVQDNPQITAEQLAADLKIFSSTSDNRTWVGVGYSHSDIGWCTIGTNALGDALASDPQVTSDFRVTQVTRYSPKAVGGQLSNSGLLFCVGLALIAGGIVGYIAPLEIPATVFATPGEVRRKLRLPIVGELGRFQLPQPQNAFNRIRLYLTAVRTSEWALLLILIAVLFGNLPARPVAPPTDPLTLIAQSVGTLIPR